MLDASLRVNILNVLTDLRDELDMTVLFITHDIGQACYVADQVLVMEHGVMVEQGTDEVIFNPQHEYTQQLLADVPKLHEEIELHDLHEDLRQVGSWPESPAGADAEDRCTRRMDRPRTRGETRQGECRGLIPHKCRLRTYRSDGRRGHSRPLPGQE